MRRRSAADSVYFCRRHIEIAAAAAAQTETPRSVMLSDILQERGYETENVSLTYRWVVDDPLQAAGGGEKAGNRFELYRYADEETARRAYGQVVNLIAPEMESAARASHQTELTGGGSMFTVILDGVLSCADPKQ